MSCVFSCTCIIMLNPLGRAADVRWNSCYTTNNSDKIRSIVTKIDRSLFTRNRLTEKVKLRYKSDRSSIFILLAVVSEIRRLIG